MSSLSFSNSTDGLHVARRALWPSQVTQPRRRHDRTVVVPHLSGISYALAAIDVYAMCVNLAFMQHLPWRWMSHWRVPLAQVDPISLHVHACEGRHIARCFESSCAAMPVVLGGSELSIPAYQVMETAIWSMTSLRQPRVG